jgi:hypothetical protein
MHSLYSTSKQQKQQSETHVQRLMDLYRGSTYGLGFRKYVKRNEVKNKNEFEKDKGIKTHKGQLEEQQVLDHLNGGDIIVGVGPVLDDGTVWWGCIDGDKIGDNVAYEVDYAGEMEKITRSGLPLVVDRSKSGGIHLKVFCSEPISADLVQQFLRQCAAQLGYAGNEIFPKQTKLENAEDCSSWVFLPYGPTWDVFAEQCGMNESGNAIALEQYLFLAESKRISREELLQYSEKLGGGSRGNGKGSGGRGSSHGRWELCKKDNGDIDVAATREGMFSKGPPCLLILARQGASSFQHNYLLNVCILMRKQFPDNWVDAVKFVNDWVLNPPGDNAKLDELIKSLKNRNYYYTCNDEPIVSHCLSHACVRMPYGIKAVGSYGGSWMELGMTIVDRVPRIYIVNAGDARLSLGSDDLLNMKKFRTKCLEVGVDFPNTVKQAEWDLVVRRGIEEATVVEPSVLLRGDVEELEVLERWFGSNIPTLVWSKGEEALNGMIGDFVRVKVKEGRFYFKWESLLLYARRMHLSQREITRLRMFVDQHTDAMGEGGAGVRGWLGIRMR